MYSPSRSCYCGDEDRGGGREEEEEEEEEECLIKEIYLASPPRPPKITLAVPP